MPIDKYIEAIGQFIGVDLVPDFLLRTGYTADKALSPCGGQLFGRRIARFALVDLSDYLHYVGCTVSIQINRNVDNL